MAMEAIKPIRVMLADDHPIIRDGLTFMLDGEPDIQVVAQAVDGADAVAQARRVQPDVILMDITMPGMSGIEATRRISGEFPYIRIIGLSMHEQQDVGAVMCNAGAVEYMTKGGDSDQLIAAIRRQATPDTNGQGRHD